MQVYSDFELKNILWYKVGGKARYFIEVKKKEDIYEALDFLEKNHVQKIFVCGLGANLVFSDDFYDGAIIQIASKKQKSFAPASRPSVSDIFTDPSSERLACINGNQIEVFAGELLEHAALFAFKHNLVGLEWAGGLPGTVGAGVRGNVGCFGNEIKDVLQTAELLEINGERRDIKQLTNQELHFSYRHSVIKENRNLLVLTATFQLAHAENEALENAKETYLTNIRYRQKNHPLDQTNCGSVFKNIKTPEQVQKVLAVWPDIEETVKTKWYGKVSMGYIIRRFGFAGKRVGGVEVSEKHTNFIVNHGDAKATDFKTIITEIQQKCAETFGFMPEVEVEVVE